MPLGLLLVCSLGIQAAASPSGHDCVAGRFELRGAESIAGEDEGAVFKEQWRDAVKKVSSCLHEERMKRACVEVSGRFDELKFDRKLASVFGGTSSVQATRARSRAARIISLFYEYGISSERLHELPPPSEPSYRGVELTVREDCLPPPSATVAEVTRGLAEDPEAARQFRIAASLPAEGMRSQPSATIVGAPPSPKPASQWLFIEGGAVVPVSISQPNVYAGPGLRLGAGWRNAYVLTKLDGSFSVGTVAEQRVGGSVALAVDYRLRDWFALGLNGAFSIGTLGASTPWLEQTWSLGIDVEQCPWTIADSTRLCLTQVVAPLGTRIRRAEVNAAGDIERIRQTQSYMFRLEVGAVVRRDLW